MSKAEASLKKLSSISKSLNEASDLLSKQILQIEAALNEYKLGVSVWFKIQSEEVQLPCEDSKGNVSYSVVHRVLFLGYGEFRGKWGLLVEEFYDEFGPPEPSEEVFLRDASRRIRIAAMENLPELLEKLASEATKLQEKVAQQTALAAEIAAAIRDQHSQNGRS